MTTNLIPMAGKGERFSKAGYRVSKPLIQVSNAPMILKAIDTFPKAENWIFICRKEHIDNEKIDETIKKTVPNATFLSIDYNTEGQACTCLLAKNMIQPNEPIFIGACDSSIVYDHDKYKVLISEPDTDVVCFAFTKQKNLSLNPFSWGWIKLKNNTKTIESVSVKTPISNDPFNDFAVVGFFYFKSAKLFFDIVENLIKNNVRINNEFYVDSCINQAIKMGYKAKIFIVEQYIGWGTPEDLREYEFWEKYFLRQH